MKNTDIIVLSEDLSLEAHDPSTNSVVIHNKITGRRTKVTQETMELLKLFQTIQTLEKLYSFLQINSKEERRQLKQIIQSLINSDVLKIGTSYNEEISTEDEITLVSPKNTFVNSPFVGVNELTGNGVVFCGLPVDFATTGYPGARFGPEKMRQKSTSHLQYDRDIFTLQNKGWYHSGLNKWILKDTEIKDCGDVLYQLAENPEVFYHRVEATSKHLFGLGYFPVFFGGDHSVTAPIIKGYCAKHPRLTIIQFDAHTDLGEWKPGTNHHHGNMMSRVLQENPDVHVLQFGIRGFAGLPASNPRIKQFTSEQIQDDIESVITQCPSNQTCYITFDIDSVDPAFAPGTGTPVPLGLNPGVVTKLLRRICHHNEVVGLDMVEVNPMLDSRDTTLDLSFNLIMETLGCSIKK